MQWNEYNMDQSCKSAAVPANEIISTYLRMGLTWEWCLFERIVLTNGIVIFCITLTELILILSPLRLLFRGGEERSLSFLSKMHFTCKCFLDWVQPHFWFCPVKIVPFVCFCEQQKTDNNNPIFFYMYSVAGSTKHV